MYILANALWRLRRLRSVSRLALGIAAAILISSSTTYGQQPIIIELTGSADELHWTVGRRTYSTPFKEVQPIIGPEVEWQVDVNGHLTSTINAHLQSRGNGNDGALNSVMEVRHDYTFGPCAICPATGVSITETSKFWVPQPPGTQVWIARDASREMFDISTFKENPFIDVSKIGPNVFMEVRTTYRVGGPIDLGLNRTSKTTLVGQAVPPNSLHEGVWTALTSSTTKVFDGVQYSLGLTLTETVNVDMNINTGFGLSGRINAKSMLQSTTIVSAQPRGFIECFRVGFGGFKCPPRDPNGVVMPLNFDLNRNGENDSWQHEVSIPDPDDPTQIPKYSVTDEAGNSLNLLCIPLDEGVFAPYFRPMFITPDGMPNPVGKCLYPNGRNSWMMYFEDANGDDRPDKFLKTKWVSKDYEQIPGSDEFEFTGTSTTFVTDLTKKKIVPFETESTNSFEITDATIVDLGTDLSSVMLDGEPLSGEAVDVLRTETHAETLFGALEAVDDLALVGGSFQAIAMVRNLDSISHVYNISLFGINASVDTAPPKDVALAPGEVRYFSFVGTAGQAGDAALAVYVWAETGNDYDNWGDAVVITVVPEPPTWVLLSLVAAGGTFAGLRRIARRVSKRR